MVVGGGAREHTLVWKILQSDRVSEVFAAPGNAGTADIANNLDISPSDIGALASAAQDNGIDLVVVGPEAPLALGLVDTLTGLGIRAFGPTKDAAVIESSKVFAKRLMQKYGIPCARDAAFSSFNEARDYVRNQKVPLVIKADGLAAGKGAVVAQTVEEALEALSDIMEARVFGDAGNQVLIEECLAGHETSLIAFTDGEYVVPLMPACDYKRAFDHDLGPNTGGMGVYSPPGFFGPQLTLMWVKTILKPVVRAMAQEGRKYKGVLYAGLMLTAEGPKVLEFNARFGDPETQVQIPLLKSDMVDIMLSVVDGTLGSAKVEWRDSSCVGVVMASEGYPGSYKTGLPITGLGTVDSDIRVFHAGTMMKDGQICTAGGRVLTVTATGETVADARKMVYNNLSKISFDGCYFRKDIAVEEE